MKEKKLETYLAKAEYLLVSIRNNSKIDHRPSPLLNVYRGHIRRGCNLNLLKRVPYRPSDTVKLGRLLKSSTLIKLSLIVKPSSKDYNAFKVDKMASALDLHHLHYNKIYQAYKKKAPFKWQKTQHFNGAKELKRFVQPPTNTSRSFFAKFSKISPLGSDLLKEGKETMDQNQLAMEQEYSHRRNYRTSTLLN